MKSSITSMVQVSSVYPACQFTYSNNSLILMASMTKWLTIVVLAVSILQVNTYGDVWNRIIKIQSSFSEKDYTDSGKGSDIYRGEFAIQLYSNHSFTFTIPYNSNKQQYLIAGNANIEDRFPLSGYRYILDSKEVRGSIESSISMGITWSVQLAIPSKGITLVRQQTRYIWVSWTALFALLMVGHVLFPLCDRTRNKVLYNIKKRTHPLMGFMILVKLIWLWQWFLVKTYHQLLSIEWYVWGVMFISACMMVLPSLLHFMYFLATMQRNIKESKCFKAIGMTLGCIFMMLIFISVPLVAVGLVLVPKGIITYFIMSTVTLYQFISSCRVKKYAFSKVLLFDLLLTALLTILGHFLPVLNFIPLTLKDLLIFWNYNIGLFIFGVVIAKVAIKIQIAEQVFVDQFSDALEKPPVVAQFGTPDSQRRCELPQIKTQEEMSS